MLELYPASSEKGIDVVQPDEELISRYSGLIRDGEITIADAVTKVGTEFSRQMGEEQCALHAMVHMDRINLATASLPHMDLGHLSSSLIAKWGSASAAADEFGSQVRKSWLQQRTREQIP